MAVSPPRHPHSFPPHLRLAPSRDPGHKCRTGQPWAVEDSARSQHASPHFPGPWAPLPSSPPEAFPPARRLETGPRGWGSTLTYLARITLDICQAPEKVPRSPSLERALRAPETRPSPGSANLPLLELFVAIPWPGACGSVLAAVLVVEARRRRKGGEARPRPTAAGRGNSSSTPVVAIPLIPASGRRALATGARRTTTWGKIATQNRTQKPC